MSRSLPVALWIVFTVLLLGVLYSGLKSSLAVDYTAEVQSHVYRLSVSANTQPGVTTFTVRRGDTVTLIIRSDKVAEVHVHGNEDTKVDLSPGREVTLTFVAADVGRFPVHIHDPDGSMYPLGMLEVQPR